ncbi:hypothetical protein V500_01070 [Pseudogymnoascus sp. VKM F-4518 (FW-2643)]|nr:hypothetical protein V500_01070 [Pseudogymnoascus sp. VKM F-4518 (FW-2643)]
MGPILHLTAVWLGMISIVLVSPVDASPTPAINSTATHVSLASIAADQLAAPLEPPLKTSNGTVIKLVTDDDKPTLEQSFTYNVTNFNIKTRPRDALPTSADEKTLLRIRNEESVLKKRREEQSAHAPVSDQISRFKWGPRTPLVRRAQAKLMIVGDSISQGMEGDWTWRYRLWEWLDSQGEDFEFVGPWTGTRQPPDPAPPPKPRMDGDPLPVEPPMVSGGYASGVDSRFEKPHFALWGRQAAQVKGEIQKIVADYQPTHLLVLLAFNDLGWFVTGPDGTLASIKSIVDNARAANPNINIILGDVVQRRAISIRADLPKITDQYNALLRDAVPKWNTEASPIAMAYIRDVYGCETQACPSGHDGLHPNAYGEYQIARGFSLALFYGFGIGTSTLSIPASVPGRQNPVPTNLVASASPYGITVTWDKVYGARKYGVRSRYKGLTVWDEGAVLTNRIDNTWVIKDSHYEYQIRVDNEVDGTSDWSGIVDTIAAPKTIRGPSTINTLPTETGAQVSWSPVEGAEFYVVLLFDSDTPGAWLSVVGVKGLSYTWESQNVGRRYAVAVQAWNSIGGGLPAVGRSVIPGTADKIAAPIYLQINSVDATTVELTWCGDCKETSYKLYIRSLDTDKTKLSDWKGSNVDSRTTITNIGSTNVSFLVPGVWNYEFAVSGLNGDLESPMSDGLQADHPPNSRGGGDCHLCVTVEPLPTDPVPETNPGTLPVTPVLGGPDRDLSDQICAMTWQTSNVPPTSEDANTITKTWSDSRASEYLHTFLGDLEKTTDKTNDWLTPFFKQSTRSCSEPVNGGTAADCRFLEASTCTIDAAPKCSDYCPPESMFIHVSIVHFFSAYNKLYQGITNHALTTLATNVGDISNTFAPIDTSVQTLFSILGGVLGSMSSVGWLVGAGYTRANAGGAAISLFSSLISNTQLNGDDEPDVKAELSTILGITLGLVFSKINETVSNVLNPKEHKGNISLIESVFESGAFLDNTIVSYSVNTMISAFNLTMVCITPREALQKGPPTDAYCPWSQGYAFLINDSDTYGDSESCTGIGNEAMIWYKNSCIGFGRYTNLLSGGIQTSSTEFLKDGLITELKKYVPDLRLAIINSYECYADPNRKDHETDFSTFDLTNLGMYPPCFFNIGSRYIHPAKV